MPKRSRVDAAGSVQGAPVEVSQPSPEAAGVEPLPMELASTLEAVVLSLDRPAPATRLAEALGLLPKRDGDGEHAEDAPAVARAVAMIERAVGELNASYEATGRSFRIELVAGGYRLLTLPRFAGAVAAFHRARANTRLSRAAIETLAIIAYKQPITRAELEAIRGVSCGEVLKSLIDRKLIDFRGRAEELGRPILYGTTRRFLDHFGLASIKDLPQPGEFLSAAEARPGS